MSLKIQSFPGNWLQYIHYNHISKLGFFRPLYVEGVTLLQLSNNKHNDVFFPIPGSIILLSLALFTTASY